MKKSVLRKQNQIKLSLWKVKEFLKLPRQLQFEILNEYKEKFGADINASEVNPENVFNNPNINKFVKYLLIYYD
ncbi:MAG: hypothetical protein K9M56_01765 [Victivallales bacterium]|nr:hypothetical protein [Victivallales bacterium]